MAPGTHPDASRLLPFTVGDWLVEPKACRLSSGGTVVRLRPQLMDLLVCLARRAGQIVLKDEILADVWPGQYIAESGLSRCVAELRQHLQDDAQKPRFIETFPKRGYRLIPAVTWIDTPDRADAEGARLTPVAAGSDAGLPDLPLEVPHARAGSRWKVAVAGVVAVATAVAMGAGDWGSSAGLSERDAVLLADMINTTGDPVFDDTLRLALAVKLEQAPFLRILPKEDVRAAVARTGRSPDTRVVGELARDVCRREGAAVLFAASIAPLGTRYAIGIEATACDSGEELGRTLAEADSKEQVLMALDRAASGIRRRMGESRTSMRQHNVPLVRATTPSLEALQALTLGDAARDHARLPEALTLYRQATTLDPEFALAWARRGAAARTLELTEEAIPAFRRAFELRDRVSVPERFYIAAHYYRIVEGEPQKAIETYQAWKRMYPGSAVPPTNLASLRNSWMGQYDAALPEAREAVRLAPHSSIASANLVTACLGSGRIAEARSALADASSRGADDQLIHEYLLNLAIYDGDRVALDRESRWAAADPVAMRLAQRVLALEATASGRLRDARRLWSEMPAGLSDAWTASREAMHFLSRAEAEALVGDATAARSAIDAALAVDSGASTLVYSAIVLNLAGDTARASATLDVASQRPGLDALSRRIWLPLAQALNAASLGQPEQARRFLDLVTAFERGIGFNLVPLGVRAIVERAARRPLAAAAAFEEILRLRVLDPASPWMAFARLGLARALRDAGDTARSLVAYDAFLASWQGADPDAPLLLAAMAERTAVAGP